MKLGFDATSLTSEGKGLARFQREFLAAAAAIGKPEELVAFVPERPDESALPDAAGWRYVPVRTRPMLRWEQWGLPRAARREGVDVMLTLSERAALWGPPRVVYVFEHPRHRAARGREVGMSARQRLVDATTVWLFGLSVRRAAAVLAASESTARDIGRAQVVHSAASSVFSPGPAEASYLLHLASDDPRDNSGVVLEAYARLEERPGLVIGGRAPQALRDEAARLGLDVTWAGFVTGEALADLYRGAIAYVDPSLYEGFGLQALEALACGTPAIASNVTSLPEVVGDAGILLDPGDVAGFVEAMRGVAADPELRADLRGKALAQAARFSWQRTASEVLAVCEATALARVGGRRPVSGTQT